VEALQKKGGKGKADVFWTLLSQKISIAQITKKPKETEELRIIGGRVQEKRELLRAEQYAEG
jgi:hypothetical protein